MMAIEVAGIPYFLTIFISDDFSTVYMQIHFNVILPKDIGRMTLNEFAYRL